MGFILILAISVTTSLLLFRSKVFDKFHIELNNFFTRELCSNPLRFDMFYISQPDKWKLFTIYQRHQVFFFFSYNIHKKFLKNKIT